MILKRLFCLSAVLLTGLLLNGCGQKGPLYMPDEADAPENGTENTTTQVITLPTQHTTHQQQAI
jgi:predicted small lipoprotein YifL